MPAPRSDSGPSPRAETRQELLGLLAEKSFRLGNFRLSSGGVSDYYIDCRLTTLDARGALLTGRLFLGALRGGAAVEAVGGLTLGADPIVVAVAVASALEPPPIGAFIVRKQEKAHGTGQRIEGTVRPGLPVAILDDVCTTAASTMQAIEAAWQADLDVRRVLCLVEREEAGGRARLEEFWRGRTGQGCPFTALFTAAQVRERHLAQAGRRPA